MARSESENCRSNPSTAPTSPTTSRSGRSPSDVSAPQAVAITLRLGSRAARTNELRSDLRELPTVANLAGRVSKDGARVLPPHRQGMRALLLQE